MINQLRRFRHGLAGSFWFALLFFSFTLPAESFADSALLQWRGALAQTRILAENDAPRAYLEAQRLQAALPASATPADRVRVLNLLARNETYLALTTQADKHAQLALSLAERHEDREGQAEALLDQALNAINQGRIDALAAAASRSVELLDGVNRPDLLGEALLRLSMMYRRQGQLDDSVTVAMQAMEIAKHSDNPLALAYAHQGLAVSYHQSGREMEAREHYLEMREQARAARSKLLEAQAIRSLGELACKSGDLVGAERLARESIAMYRSVGAPFALNSGLHSLAAMFGRHGRSSEAVRLLDETIAIYAKHPNPIGLWYALDTRSANLQALGHSGAAKTDAEKAYALAGKIGFPLYRSESARHMATIAEAAGEHRRAYRFAVEAADIAERAAREKTGTRMIELVRRYRIESRQRHIDELNRNNERQAAELRQHALEQRWLWSMLGGSLAMLLVSAIFLLRLQRAHHKLQAAGTQLGLMDFALNHVYEAVYLSDAGNRIIYANQEACRALGYRREELLAMDISDIDADAAPANPASIEQDGKVSATPSAERHHRTKEGRIFPVEILSAGFEYLGRPVAIALVRDITERRQAEAALRARAELEQRLSAMAASVPGFIFTIRVGPDGHTSVPYASAGVEDLFGLSPEEIRDDADVLRNRYHPDDLPRLLALMKETERTLAPFHIDIRIANRDNGPSWIEIRSVPHRQPDGGTEWHGIMLDITARKQAECELEESRAQLRGLAARTEEAREEERKRIAREVHDELGQILTGLQLNVTMLADLCPGDAAPLPELKQDTLNLTAQALSVARNVVAQLRPAALDMGIVVALEWLADNFASNTGIPCTAHIENSALQLDESRAIALLRIVQESLTNVARHAQAKQVDISLDKGANDYFVLKISDNGVGFDSSAKKPASFGLLGIRERAFLLGGTASIDSRPGKGTRIEVRVPAHLNSEKT